MSLRDVLARPVVRFSRLTVQPLQGRGQAVGKISARLLLAGVACLGIASAFSLPAPPACLARSRGGASSLAMVLTWPKLCVTVLTCLAPRANRPASPPRTQPPYLQKNIVHGPCPLSMMSGCV